MSDVSVGASAGEWWQEPHRFLADGRLHFGDQDVAAFARGRETPFFIHSAGRVRANLERLVSALERAGMPHRIFYAMKANRFAPLVERMHSWGLCGIDTCSPDEVLYALERGFAETDILFTGHAVSNADLDVLAAHPGVHVNCDAISTIRRLGERSPGRAIGIRINPQVGAGYHAGVHYAGAKPSKFGLYPDRFDEALAVAASFGMRVTELHFHFGYGYLTQDLPRLDAALDATRWFMDRCPDLETVDIGGGLGSRITEDREPLDLDAWATLIATHLKPRGLTVHLEPGDYLQKDAGALVCEVNTVEEKAGLLIAGVNAGLNLQSLWAYYQTPFIATPVEPRAGDRKRYMVTGNINEAIDILAEDAVLPPLEDGDLIALMNAGGYGSACASNHCMRGRFGEYLVD
jgi:diaminopimelate decarboxylase